MPKCKNDPKRSYKGTEPSPKGIGYCAHAEKSGSKKKGKDGNMWIIKEVKGSKRWFKYSNEKSESPNKNDTSKNKSSGKYNLLSFRHWHSWIPEVAFMISRNDEDLRYKYTKTPIAYFDDQGNLYFGNIPSQKEIVIIPKKDITMKILSNYRVTPHIGLYFTLNRNKYIIKIWTVANPTIEQEKIYKLIGFKQPKLIGYTNISDKKGNNARKTGKILELVPKEWNSSEIIDSNYGITFLLNKKEVKNILSKLENANKKVITSNKIIIYLPAGFGYLGKEYKKSDGFTVKDILMKAVELYPVMIKNFGYAQAVWKDGKPSRYYYIYSPSPKMKSIKSSRNTATIIKGNEVFIGLEG